MLVLVTEVNACEAGHKRIITSSRMRVCSLWALRRLDHA